MKAKAILLIAVSAVAVVPSSVWAQRYLEITAEIEMTSNWLKDTNGAAIERRTTNHVKCIVGTNEWRIDNDFSMNGRNAYFFDGTNVYQLMEQTANTPNSFGTNSYYFQPNSPAEHWRSNVTIHITPSPGGHPLGDAGVNLPWLAFCSGSYLKLAGRTIPLPTAYTRGTPDSFAYTDKTEVIDDPLRLPKKVELFTSRAKYKSGVYDKRLIRTKAVENARVEPISTMQDGKVRFLYEAREFTNVFGWSIPSSFSYSTFSPNKQGSWECLYSGTGALISVREGASPTNVFVNDKIQTIVDFRFRHDTKMVDGISYHTTNSHSVFGTNDPALAAKYERELERGHTEPYLVNSKWRRIPMFSVTLISVISLIFALRFVQREKNNPQKLSKE